jgi:thiol-disulfide isomerase/thioredoxin
MRIKKILILITISLPGFAAGLHAQDSARAPIVGFSYVDSLMQQKNDTTILINFWATWCAPCVHELPHFDNLLTRYAGKKLKVVLVSLDFKRNYQSALLPFLKKNKIQSPVVLMYEPGAGDWITQVDSTWSGAIPATLIFNRNKRQFFENELSEQELHNLVDSFIKP